MAFERYERLSIAHGFNSKNDFTTFDHRKQWSKATYPIHK
ncbi:uncharacterized protein G2W53_036978 [Senna tora]|uniref:Uncharacterized protein n=1 Tax=Senna tora TaxID=362788 RepID=A0A834STU8_9FABA|nr:uncharacterized protein G2W53_036978 [Senna tora]